MEVSVSISLLQSQLAMIEKNIATSERLIQAMNQSVWLTDKELAERWKMSLSTLNIWRVKYNIPCSQIGDIRRYQASVVDEWYANYSAQGIVSLKHKKAA